MDFGDWAFTAPYARCVEANDQASIAQLERMYLSAAQEAIGYYRGLSQRVAGRDIPYVILLHTSAFEARMMPRLIELYRSAGFRFVTLAQAESDPFYTDQTDPALPAEPQGLEQRALAKEITLPKRTDYQAQLSAVCAAHAPGVTP